MRTITLSNNGVITYPNQTVFAFSPNTLYVTIPDTLPDNSPVTITGNGLSFTRNCLNGSVIFPLDGLLKSLFDAESISRVTEGVDMQEMQSIKSLDVKVYYNYTLQATYETLSFTVIWGALQLGETYNVVTQKKWWVNLPFTTGIIGASTNTVLAKFGGNSTINLGEKGSIGTLISPEDITGHTQDQLLIVQFADGVQITTFGIEFDKTFQSENVGVLKLIPYTCTDGHYLRWVNQIGDFEYHLLKQSFDTGISTETGAKELVNYYPTSESDTLIGRSRITQKTGRDSLLAGDVAIDEYDYQKLKYLLLSPIVQYYNQVTQKWIGIRISDATLSPENEVLKQFNCTIVFPDYYTQHI